MMRKFTLLYGLALSAERAVSFFLMPVLAKAITPSEYAIWSQSVVTAGVLTPVVLLGFQTTLIKYVPRWRASSPETHDSIVLAMLTGISFSVVVVALIATLCSGAAARAVYGASIHAPYVPLLCILLVSEALFEFLVALLRSNNRIPTISAYTLLKGIWRLLIFIVVLHWSRSNFIQAFSIFVFVQLSCVIIMYLKDVPLARIVNVGLSLGRQNWMDVLSFSIPLVGLAVMTGLSNFSDRYFLAHFSDLGEVASYSAVYSLAAMAAFFYSVLGFTLFPVLSAAWANGSREEVVSVFSKALQGYLFLICPFVAGLVFAGPSLLLLLTTHAYVAKRAVFLLLGCSIGLFGIYSLYLYVLLLGGESSRTLRMISLSTGINVLLNLLFVPGLGAVGAAIASCTSNAVLAGVTIREAQRILPWRFPWRNLMHIAFRVLVVIVVLVVGESLLGFDKAWQFWSIVFLAVFLYLGLDLLFGGTFAMLAGR